MKKNLWLLTFVFVFALGILILAVAGCGRTTALSDNKFLPMPHVNDIRFENCNTCHAADQLILTNAPFDHSLYTNANCTQAGCHKFQAPTTTPPITTTTPPTGTGTTTPPTGTGTIPPTGTTTSPPAATLSATGIDIITHNAAAMTAYKDVCLVCHGLTAVFPSLQPYPPVWGGSLVTPGTFQIVPGSPQDHTNVTNATCTDPGCHAVKS